ncbi:unnamed protein product [Soboliphyme baturini]|uniref:BTB domain-containing protein n=1 Tax=Soboliphyme baturini TaxID=241478 RepID=A0A183ICJ8_9BILA|nr:unnamed protein product [Soboliphyme baturini]
MGEPEAVRENDKEKQKSNDGETVMKNNSNCFVGLADGRGLSLKNLVNPVVSLGRQNLSNVNGPSFVYVKLNVGGSLYYTTISTLTKQDSMLRAMFSGRMEVLTDSDGWILIDRCGKHFNLILNYLRDGAVALPDSRQDIREILAEAKYYCLQGLIDLCQSWLDSSQSAETAVICRVPIIVTAREEKLLLQSTSKPVIKLLLNRHNNKYSYTSQSDDNLLKNLELFDKLVLRFNERVLFIKDVEAANEVCSWTFYGYGRKVAEVCCTSILYATDKKHTKVEYPEARIYEEAMNILLYEPTAKPTTMPISVDSHSLYHRCLDETEGLNDGLPPFQGQHPKIDL